MKPQRRTTRRAPARSEVPVARDWQPQQPGAQAPRRGRRSAEQRTLRKGWHGVPIASPPTPKEGEKRATHLQPKWHTVCTRLRTSRHHHPCRTPATRGMTHPSACPSLRHTSWVAGATTAPARPTRQMGVTLDCCWHPFSIDCFAARVVMVDAPATRRSAQQHLSKACCYNYCHDRYYPC